MSLLCAKLHSYHDLQGTVLHTLHVACKFEDDVGLIDDNDVGDTFR